MTTRPKRPGPSVQKVPAASDVPVTRNMLMAVRDELSARLEQHTAQFAVLEARIDQTNARIDQANARIDRLEAEVRELRHEFVGFRAEMRAEVARIKTLAEDQESRNRVVLEAVQGHLTRFERIEAEQAAQRVMLQEILAAVTRRP